MWTKQHDQCAETQVKIICKQAKQQLIDVLFSEGGVIDHPVHQTRGQRDDSSGVTIPKLSLEIFNNPNYLWYSPILNTCLECEIESALHPVEWELNHEYKAALPPGRDFSLETACAYFTALGIPYRTLVFAFVWKTHALAVTHLFSDWRLWSWSRPAGSPLLQLHSNSVLPSLNCSCLNCWLIIVFKVMTPVVFTRS
jgi:hypothetical protein